MNQLSARAIVNLGLSLLKKDDIYVKDQGKYVVVDRSGGRVVVQPSILTELKRQAGLPMHGRKPS